MRNGRWRAGQNLSGLWSGKVERDGGDLLVPWHGSGASGVTSLRVPENRAADLAAALLAQLPGGSGFVDDVMRRSLIDRIPDEYLDKAVECTTHAALIAIEQALALSARVREEEERSGKKALAVKPPAVTRKWGTDNIIPTGEHEGIL